ncbi:hypothetical protein CV014_12150 [Nostoc sp. CMAA1605]|nr:hypothetical protein [Nostoc sp. CMAA1605]
MAIFSTVFILVWVAIRGRGAGGREQGEKELMTISLSPVTCNLSPLFLLNMTVFKLFSKLTRIYAIPGT